MLLFWQNPSFLSQISLREDLVQHESVSPSPCRDPGLCQGPLPPAPPSPGVAESTSLAGLCSQASGQFPNHIPGGNRSRIQAPSPRVWRAAASQPSQGEPCSSQASFSRSHSALTKQPPELLLGSSAPPKRDRGEFWQHQHGRAMLSQLSERGVFGQDRAELCALPSIPGAGWDARELRQERG